MKSRVFVLRVWGDLACFTRPELKAERVSYDVITPSAASAIFESVLWKPAISWEITRIEVMKPIRWMSIRRNELGSVIPVRKVSGVMSRGAGNLGIYIEDDRQQRGGLILKEVEYRIHARMVMSERRGASDSVKKFESMFLRRAEKGQCVNQPYLGCREFSGFFALETTTPLDQPIDESSDLGWMLRRPDYAGGGHPELFHALMVNGVIDIPSAPAS